jgi:thiol-disulfide isomerase/thioredoxin
VNAPGPGMFRPDSSGDYVSVAMTVDGKATIVFDPRALLTRDSSSCAVSIRGNAPDEAIYGVYQEYVMKQGGALEQRRAFRDTKKNPHDFHYDGGTYFTDLVKRVETEKDPEVADVLRTVYVSFAGVRPLQYDSARATTYFKAISPASVAWDLIPGAFFQAPELFPQPEWFEAEDRFLKESHSGNIKSEILARRLMGAKLSGNKEELKKLHALIATEYKDRPELLEVLKRVPVESDIAVGAPVPAFAITSLDDSAKTYSRATMLGKIYMIDFWATWCAPCVGEMESLHKAFKKYHRKGLEIISLSLDAHPEDIQKFRKTKWAMPWKHGFLGTKEGEKIRGAFEVIGIPKPILVGADGKILALEGDLRGENLGKTLAKFLR